MNAPDLFSVTTDPIKFYKEEILVGLSFGTFVVLMLLLHILGKAFRPAKLLFTAIWIFLRYIWSWVSKLIISTAIWLGIIYAAYQWLLNSLNPVGVVVQSNGKILQ